MQQTFEINAGQLDQIFDAVLAKFGKRRVRVVIEDLPAAEAVDQREMFKKTEELRLKLRKVKVDPNLNLSDLANDMLDAPL